MKKQEVTIAFPVRREEKDMVIDNFVNNALQYMKLSADLINTTSTDKLKEHMDLIRKSLRMADAELEKAQQLVEEFDKDEEPPPIPLKKEDIIEEKEEEDIASDVFSGADGL